MILRKPYAILIKYFRIIHLFITIITAFILFSFLNVRTVFKIYNDSGWLSAKNLILDSNYITIFLYVLIILVITLLIILYVLMRFKKKPRLLYILTTIFYILLFFLLIFDNNIFKKIVDDTISTSTLKLYSDINVISLFILGLILIVMLIRSIGFDIKKFNFEKDIEELRVSASDNEEFELTLGVDDEEYKRKIRKQIRELRIYYKENKFIVNLIISGIFIGISLIVTTTVLIFDNTYSENKKVKIDNGIYLKVLDSHITTTNDFGIKITDNNILLINFEVINKSGKDYQIFTNEFNVSVGNNIYHPITNEYSNFFSRGNGYSNQVIKSGNKEKYFIIYEIKNENKYKKVYLSYQNKKVKLKPNNLNESNIIDTGQKVTFKITETFSFDFKIDYYTISNSFSKIVKDADNQYIEAETLEGYLPEGMTLLKLIGVTIDTGDEDIVVTGISFNNSSILYNYNGIMQTYKITQFYQYNGGKYIYIVAPEELIYSKKVVLSIGFGEGEFNYIIKNS